MKKTILLLGAICLVAGAFAADIVLDIKLNGSEIEAGKKVNKVMERGILVIEDIGAETNVHKGTLYLLEGKGNGKGKKKSYEAQDATVRIVSNNKSAFGLLVEVDDACLAGIGKAVVDKDGKFKQIIISSGHGVFLYTGFDMEDPAVTNEVPVVTNAVPVDGVSSNIDTMIEVDERVLEELEAGKMQAKLNKKLTEAAEGTNGTCVVECWLDEGVTPGKKKDKPKGYEKK